MPWDAELTATFYVRHPPVPAAEEWLATQLDLIGVMDVRVSRVVVEALPGPGLDQDDVTGRWAGMGVEVRDHDLDLSRAVSLVFSEASIRAADRGEGLPAFWRAVTDTFGAACERLQPFAAFVTDLPDADVDTTVVDQEQGLVALDPGPLLGAGFALLYLSDAWFPDLERFLVGRPEDRIPLAGGPLLVGYDDTED